MRLLRSVHSNFVHLLLFPVVFKARKGSNETCCPIQAHAGKIMFSRCFLLPLGTACICLNLCFSYAVSVGPLKSDLVVKGGISVRFVVVTAALIACTFFLCRA